jgi:basement membrane-specific heparan sulfate proteoglycan core protein
MEIGKRHTIKISRVRTGGTLTVDDEAPVNGNVHGVFEGLNLIENLFVGGVPSFQKIHRLAGENSPKAFLVSFTENWIFG